MKGIKILVLVLVVVTFQSCKTAEVSSTSNEGLVGKYELMNKLLYQALSDKNYSYLELNTDGSFILFKSEVKFSPTIEQCDYASKGKWSLLAENIIQITSEDYYSQQKGFEYSIKKENKLSQDSLYIKVNFAEDFNPPVSLGFYFNYQKDTILKDGETFVTLPKSKYLWDKHISTNDIYFSIDEAVQGLTQYKPRAHFYIFEESIDTEKYNSLTINLPNFDRCFFEFEPYNQELIYIKNNKQLFWLGENWKKR